MNEIYIVMDADFTGAETIIGIFDDKAQAKLFLAEYVLDNNNVHSNSIELIQREVEVSHK
ncbi:hypothetical protein [Gracilibacillus alcaliphilus]|uniref:hypothetical protein n=1 Tax=Gracilibacillus alcaliphilus TaxID=1401441 RepID=UPI00195C2E95|nr:hypothetical protein [Gracilibacillus alcaliphilus]MBM7679552.1 hypothetical protein [Gracilibacillus alcaliphilus]